MIGSAFLRYGGDLHRLNVPMPSEFRRGGALSASFEWKASDGSGVLGSWDEIVRIVTLVGPYTGWSSVSLLPRRFALARTFQCFHKFDEAILSRVLAFEGFSPVRRAQFLGRARKRRYFTWSGQRLARCSTDASAFHIGTTFQ